MAMSTVRKGRDEVRAGARSDDVVKVRRSTGKRPFEVVHPEVWPALEKLVNPAVVIRSVFQPSSPDWGMLLTSKAGETAAVG
jgi:hypothetical protein